MNPLHSFPTELSERKQLNSATVAVIDLLWDRPTGVEIHGTSWEPAMWLPDPSAPCPSIVPETWPTHVPERRRYKFVTPELGYNDRLARIAQAIVPLVPCLRLAGLPARDLETWEAHRPGAGNTTEGPDAAREAAQGLLFVNDVDVHWYLQLVLSAEDGQRVRRCQELVERLRRAVGRIERTVSPHAVLDRLLVHNDLKAAELDGIKFEPLNPRGEGLYLHYLRLAKGEWVSSAEIAKREGLAEVKVTRVLQSLERRFQPLRRIVETNQGDGGRIVLPLAPA